MAYEWDAFADPAPRGYRPPVQRTEIDFAEEILETYVGEYERSSEMPLVVTLENGQLNLGVTGYWKAPLFAEAEDKFFLRVADAQISFTKDESGEVTGLIFHQGGREQRASKVG